jgi:hypothetical protein
MRWKILDRKFKKRKVGSLIIFVLCFLEDIPENGRMIGGKKPRIIGQSNDWVPFKIK